MMDFKMHSTAAWATTSGAAASDDDVKMLLEDLDDASSAATADDDSNATRLALSLDADASAIAMMMLLPGDDLGATTTATATTLSEDEQRKHVGDELESPDLNDDDDFDEELWTAAAAAHSTSEPFDLIDADAEPMALDTTATLDSTVVACNKTIVLPATASQLLFGDALVPSIGDPLNSVLASTTKRRGRKPTAKPKAAAPKKPKRAPPSPSKARLRNYERRSRTKREHTMLSMKDLVASLESQITTFCNTQQTLSLADTKQQQICTMALEAIALNHQNFHLRRAIDDHRFFHSMIDLEVEHRDTTPLAVLDDLSTPPSWHPLTETACFRFMRESYDEIATFASSEDFVSSGLEICGWREKRKLCGTSVKFQFTKHFAKDCSEDLATRSWEMRAVQDQVTRYFGPFLHVQVEVIQRIATDVVVVRRKITHTQDHWVHHTIYLLFRTKTADGHLVCIRDMNPADTATAFGSDVSHTTTAGPPSHVIWSNCFIWWKFTTAPPSDTATVPSGFEVEYGGSLSSATSADAAFWMREVLLLALRWENLVVGPLLTL